MNRREQEQTARDRAALEEQRLANDQLFAQLIEARDEAAALRAEVDRLTGWIREIHYDADCHHDGERPHELAHALAVEIPHLCMEALDGKQLPQIRHDQVPVCSSTGEIGCLDCTEGICDGITGYDWRTFCACGADDVYGEMDHSEDCPLAPPRRLTCPRPGCGAWLVRETDALAAFACGETYRKEDCR